MAWKFLRLRWALASIQKYWSQWLVNISLFGEHSFFLFRYTKVTPGRNYRAVIQFQICGVWVKVVATPRSHNRSFGCKKVEITWLWQSPCTTYVVRKKVEFQKKPCLLLLRQCVWYLYKLLTQILEGVCSLLFSLNNMRQTSWSPQIVLWFLLRLKP